MRRLFLFIMLGFIFGLTCTAGAAVTYTPFTGPDGVALVLNNIGMIGDGVGYGTVNSAGGSAVLHKTTDGAATWSQVGALATDNASPDGHLEFYFGADEIWYTTLVKSSMYAYSAGKLGVSRDEGATWTDFNDQIDSIMAAASSPRDSFAKAAALPGLFVTTGRMGNTWGFSKDGGADWTWGQNQFFFGRFKAGQSQVYMAGKTEMTVPYYNLNRYDPATGTFVNLDAAVPADLYLGTWHVFETAMASVLTLTDVETATYTPATYVVGSADAGTTFTTFFQDEEGFTLLDGLVINSTMAFIAGQATVDGATRLQIRMTFNAGASWTTLVDEATTDTASFTFDNAGTVFAVRSQAGAMGAPGGAIGVWRLSMN